MPKQLLTRVEKLEGSKAPVKEILEVLDVEMWGKCPISYNVT
jgi:hypothetical protein